MSPMLDINVRGHVEGEDSESKWTTAKIATGKNLIQHKAPRSPSCVDLASTPLYLTQERVTQSSPNDNFPTPASSVTLLATDFESFFCEHMTSRTLDLAQHADATKFPSGPEDIPSAQIRKRRIRSSVMMSRFMTVNPREDALRYEAEIACREERVSKGEDMFARLQFEKEWEDVLRMD